MLYPVCTSRLRLCGPILSWSRARHRAPREGHSLGVPLCVPVWALACMPAGKKDAARFVFVLYNLLEHKMVPEAAELQVWR